MSAITKRRQVLGDAHPATVLTRTALARMYEKQGRYAEAEDQLLTAASALHMEQPGRPLAPTLHAEGNEVDIGKRLVGLYDAWGKLDKAAEWRAKLRKQPPQP